MSGPGPEPPTVNSLLIAERVFRDAETGEWIIAGVFNELTVNRLPAVCERIEVFFQMTNVGRNVDLHLRIEHADSGEVIVDVGGPITAADRLRVVENRVVFRGAPFAKEGKYWVQLLSREEILTQAPLHVRLVQETTHARNEDQDVQ